MTPGEINRELDKLSKRGSILNEKMIAAGRGYETSSETMSSKNTDPLTVEYQLNAARSYDLRYEISRRWGPGAPARFPAGWPRRSTGSMSGKAWAKAGR
jgi:hypothetical protein